MKTYIDAEGATLSAFQLEGPTLLNTAMGEACGEAGQWAVYVPAHHGLPILMTDEAFAASFTAAE